MALIEIALQKELFVDDYLIKSMSCFTQVLNHAEKVVDNPVLRPEHPWEGGDVNVEHVRWDDEDGQFKMRYADTQRESRRGEERVIVEGGGEGRTCFAVSEDGIHWQKPVVGEVKYEGSKENNILPQDWLMGYTYPDPNAKNRPRTSEGMSGSATRDHRA